MIITGIIATKNRSNLLEKAIQSALNQTQKPDKLIIVSDSDIANQESENTMCQSLKVTFLKNICARNYAGSLNTAVYTLISDRLFQSYDFSDIYLAFLDDDDVWHSDYIETCVDSIKHNEDIIISGINYRNEDGTKPLSIPQKIELLDFLKGNPHIQGSNTFIKLTLLLKAGMFDESMPSTTDRDLFIRIMLLNPSYAVVNKHLVDIDASNSRNRITNNKELKTDGLRKFFYKYAGLMNKEVKDAFFERSDRIHSINRQAIETDANMFMPPSSEIPRDNKKYQGWLTAGFIATDHELGLRLLRQLLDLKREKTKIVILINFTGSVHHYETILAHSNYSYELITHSKISKEFEGGMLTGLVDKDQIGKIPIEDIAVSRSLLQHYLYNYTNDSDTIWILDDDMELCGLRREANSLTNHSVDIDGAIEMYREKYDAVVGNYALDPPLPALAVLRTALLDYFYSKTGLPCNAAFFRPIEDYYYDLTDESNIHLEMPVHGVDNISLEYIFSGKASTRPLYIERCQTKEIKSRGGNTFIFNRALLLIPNWSLQICGGIGRRSDYFWVLLAKKKYKVANVPFAITHNRKKTSFNYDKEQKKMLLDIVGASFTKAIEEVGLEAKRNEFFAGYKKAFVRRLTKYFASYYRIMGLLQIINEDIPYAKEFTAARLNKFVRDSENYILHENVASSFNLLRKKLHLHKQNTLYPQNEIEQEIKNIFGCKNLKLLGFGNEGRVFTDGRFVYKWFYEKPNNWEFLKSIPFAKCSQMYKIDLTEHCGRHIISYKYESSEEYNGSHSIQLANLIAFGRQNGFVLTNIKKRNFIVAGSELKIIDYGYSIEPFTEEKYLRSIKRGYEMLRYHFLSEVEFGNLIILHYAGNKRADAIDSGYELFKLLLTKRQKEDIHDKPILKILHSVTDQKVLDYGAGKCKIANYMALKNDVSVYDIDKEILYKYAENNVRVVDQLDAMQPNSFDLILNNLVLCCTTDEDNNDILGSITKHLKIGGRAIISICSPFFNSVSHTELRTTGNQGQYKNAGVFNKHLRYPTNCVRHEHHRPIGYYEKILRFYGLEIKNVIECEGIDTKTILPIAEHIIFDCTHVEKDISNGTSQNLQNQASRENVVVYVHGADAPTAKIKRLIDSLRHQTYQRFFVVFVCDVSKDEEAEYVRFILQNDVSLKDRSLVLNSGMNTGILANFVLAMKNIVINPQTVVINVEGNGYFTTSSAIEVIVAEFNKGADITCGNCIRYDKPLREYSIYSFDKPWERNGDNLWLRPLCFRRKLFDFINVESDLKIDGQFVGANTALAVILPMIRHSRKNVFIKDILYYSELYESASDGKREIRQQLLQKARRKHEENNIGSW
ncbi:MAG: glycosyltransferase [Treponema sp.]|nr:glycosyltransferase [Treponema sp.]